METSHPSKNPFPKLAVALSAALLAGFALAGCGKEETPNGPAVDPNAKVRLDNPKGGEALKVGATLNVKWTAIDKDPNDLVNNVDLRISLDDGVTWGFIQTASVKKADAKWGNFPWVIPDSVAIFGIKTVVNSQKCKVQVRQYESSDSTKIAISPAFSITP